MLCQQQLPEARAVSLWLPRELGSLTSPPPQHLKGAGFGIYFL